MITAFFTSSLPACFGFSFTVDYLFEIGLGLYNQGRYSEALHEFKKTLLIQPNYKPALEYIQKIEKEPPAEVILPLEAPSGEFSEEREREIAQILELLEVRVPPPPSAVVPAEMIKLDEALFKTTPFIELEQGGSIRISGQIIKRCLVIQPDILKVERNNRDEILVTANNIGYTDMHIWDERARWTLGFLTKLARPQGITLEEKMRLEQEQSENFKLGYALDWSSYESGRRINDLNRTSYSYVHTLSLDGETPYGKFESSLNVNRFEKESDVNRIALGISDGRIGPFKDFTLRGLDFFDFPPKFANLTFPGVPLRGGMLESPAFNNKLKYTAFAGRERWSGYAALFPSLTKNRESYLGGFNLQYFPVDWQDHQLTLVQGWGEDRQVELNSNNYGLSSSFDFDSWNLGYEAAHDSEHFAYTLKSAHSSPKLNLGAELRNIDKKFYSSTGSSWLHGELGGLFHSNFTPTENLDIFSNLNVYRDRLFPAADNAERWNQDFELSSVFRMNPKTAYRLNYTLRNELGRISQFRYQNIDLGISRTLNLLRPVYFSCNIYHQENDNFSSPSSSYVNDRIFVGLKINLLDDLYYYVNKELSQLKEKYTGSHSKPNALETGIDWSRKIGEHPLYGVLRFTYRDEEDVQSNLSYLTGEDYIEAYSELSYRPGEEFEIFGSARLRNIWAENPDVAKRFEASFNLGLRYLWDTGIRWDSIGNIDGYVFKDLNADGIMQRDEAPVEGIKVWLGKSKSAVTDIFGYYIFKGVRGKQAYINLDTSTVPSGFVLTTPSIQGTPIENNQTTRLYFGVVSRSEISGFIFEDIDDNKKYDRQDKGVRKVLIYLEDGSKAVTDDSGRYVFPRVAPGEHILSLDLNSLPIYYLPQAPVKKEITLFEGVTYNYNIPLKKK